MLFMFFFFNDTATTEIYTLSLHDALPIWRHDAALDSFGVGRAEHDPMPDHADRCPYHPGCADDLRSAFDGPSPGHGRDDRLPLTNGSGITAPGRAEPPASRSPRGRPGIRTTKERLPRARGAASATQAQRRARDRKSTRL